MTRLLLIGIGTGNPDHLTGQGARAIRDADLILVPRKGADRADLAELRLSIIEALRPGAPVALFDLPKRDEGGNYRAGVEAWHDAIVAAWTAAMETAPEARTIALLIWGDPSLYDSSLRIAARLSPAPEITVIPGITALQALTAAHAIPLNTVNGPVTITTGRRLRDHGWPEGAETVAVMLDGACAFTTLDPANLHIWWGAYLGMENEVLAAGPLSQMRETIPTVRAEARARHGWIMDSYLLRRT